MAWIRRQADEHVCRKPQLSVTWGVRDGDIWECDDCLRQWEVHSDQRDGAYWMPATRKVEGSDG